MRIFDPLHGFIHFNAIEESLVNSICFQRLRYIHQLGMTYLVFPGATHKRFEHSIGSMALASKIFDQLIYNASHDLSQHLPNWKDPTVKNYFRQVLRLAALCHDLGHLPFSHTAESVFLPQHGHEKMTLRLIHSPQLLSMWNIQDTIGRDMAEDIAKVAIGEKLAQKYYPTSCVDEWQRLLSEIITSDYFGADRIDYLLRDAYCTGVSYGKFDNLQLIDNLLLVEDPHSSRHLTIGIKEKAVHAAEDLLLSRYFMHSRVYQHPKIKVYAFHLVQFMKKVFGETSWEEHSVDQFLQSSDQDILQKLWLATSDKTHIGHDEACQILSKDRRYRYVPIPTAALQELTVRRMLQQLKKEWNGDLSLESDFCCDKNIYDPPPLWYLAGNGQKFNLLDRSDLCHHIIKKKPKCSYLFVKAEKENLLKNKLKDLEAVSNV